MIFRIEMACFPRQTGGKWLQKQNETAGHMTTTTKSTFAQDGDGRPIQRPEIASVSALSMGIPSAINYAA
jgi:hypothetical protein